MTSVIEIGFWVVSAHIVLACIYGYKNLIRRGWPHAGAIPVVVCMCVWSIVILWWIVVCIYYLAT